MTTIAITGASGFLGSFLVNYFSEKKYSIIALSRNPKPNYDNENIISCSFQLNKIIDESIFSNVDVLIHCAYQKYDYVNKDAFTTNVEGSSKLFDIALKANVKKIIFISSFSASKEAKSVYGRSKWAIEKLIDIDKHLILRPGLIIGKGGLFGDIIKVVSKFKILPLPDGGKHKTQTIFIKQLAEIIEKSITKDLKGIYPVAFSESISIKELCSLISEKMFNKKIYFLNIPLSIILPVIKLTESLNIHLPFKYENLVSLKNNILYHTEEIQKLTKINILDPKKSIDLLI